MRLVQQPDASHALNRLGDKLKLDERRALADKELRHSLSVLARVHTSPDIEYGFQAYPEGRMGTVSLREYAAAWHTVRLALGLKV